MTLLYVNRGYPNVFMEIETISSNAFNRAFPNNPGAFQQLLLPPQQLWKPPAGIWLSDTH